MFWGELKYYKKLAGKVQSKGTQDYPLIVGSGFGKTGTSSLAKAGSDMGFSVFHFKPGKFSKMESTESWEDFKQEGIMLVDD